MLGVTVMLIVCALMIDVWCRLQKTAVLTVSPHCCLMSGAGFRRQQFWQSVHIVVWCLVQASEDSSSDGPSTLAQVVSKTKKHTKETAKPEKTKKKRKKVLSFLLQLLYCRFILPCLPLAIIVPWLDHALNGPRSVGLACSELKQQLLSLPVFNSRECHMLILLVTSVCLFHCLSVYLSVPDLWSSP